MATRTVTARIESDGLRLVAQTGSGHTIVMDNAEGDTGVQRDEPPPHVYTEMRIVHVLDGDVEVEALRRAIELSATKFCTVTANLASGVTAIQHAYVLRDRTGEEHYGTVLVTGPHAAAAEAIATPGK